MSPPKKSELNFLFPAFVLTLTTLVHGAESPAPTPAPALLPEAWAMSKMKDQGISHKFIELIRANYDDSIRDNVIQLNVLGFVGKADYTTHYSDRAVRSSRAFLRTHAQALRSAQRRYGVAPQVIASLLWVETKYGKVMGRMPVTDVYFSLVQADHPLIIEESLKALAEKVKPAAVEPAQETKARERSVAKSQWALGELKALETLPGWSGSRLRKLRGSFAGAFGFPQFVPSSYAQWARSAAKRRKVPDLFQIEDAIQSVAHYLKANGWTPNDPESHRAALFHYNRSQGYVDVILKLAESTGFKHWDRAVAGSQPVLESSASSPALPH